MKNHEVFVLIPKQIKQNIYETVNIWINSGKLLSENYLATCITISLNVSLVIIF